MLTTSFAFAQFFGWREILRNELQLLAFETPAIGTRLSAITSAFGSESYGPRFLFWKAEQRAVGEAMIGEWRGTPACVGNLEFLKRRDDELKRWMDRLEGDLAQLARNGAADPRLEVVQHLLVELIETLDPDHIRYPAAQLQRA
jgi:hypothetical protein